MKDFLHWLFWFLVGIGIGVTVMLIYIIRKLAP